MLNEKINTGKSTIDWFLMKKPINQLIIILLLLVAYLGWQYFDNQKDLTNKVVVLDRIVKTQDSIIKQQNIEILKLKFRWISTEDYDRDDPNPRWIVDANSHEILWINPAYEEKYLKPKGYTATDLLSTTGRHIFGDVGQYEAKAYRGVFNKIANSL